MKQKGTLTISIATDKIFRDACYKMDVDFTCIQENVDTNRYEIHYEAVCDVYAVGQTVGIESFLASRPFTEDELKQG